MFALPARILADSLASPISRWLEIREREILSLGRPLDPQSQQFAADLGIKLPNYLRVELVREVPIPVSGSLLKFAKAAGFPVFRPAGMAVGRGISITSIAPRLIRHELVHVKQYQDLGHYEFIRRYLEQCFTDGYRNAALEHQARELSSE